MTHVQHWAFFVRTHAADASRKRRGQGLLLGADLLALRTAGTQSWTLRSHPSPFPLSVGELWPLGDIPNSNASSIGSPEAGSCMTLVSLQL